jgi:hypothetical protein
VDPVSPAPRDEAGIPHIRREVARPPGSAPAEENWRGANDAKHEKLRRNTLQRRAGSLELALRQSAYGYSLIDSGGKRIEDRSDLTLDEVESWLERA